MKTSKKHIARMRRRLHIRSKVSGTSARPRLSVFRSNLHIYAQIVDDTLGKTIVSASSAHLKVSKGAKRLDVSKEVGKALAKKALEKKITTVVFDRGGYQYHGRVAALADGAREGGLVF